VSFVSTSSHPLHIAVKSVQFRHVLLLLRFLLLIAVLSVSFSTGAPTSISKPLRCAFSCRRQVRVLYLSQPVYLHDQPELVQVRANSSLIFCLSSSTSDHPANRIAFKPVYLRDEPDPESFQVRPYCSVFSTSLTLLFSSACRPLPRITQPTRSFSIPVVPARTNPDPSRFRCAFTLLFSVLPITRPACPSN